MVLRYSVSLVAVLSVVARRGKSLQCCDAFSVGVGWRVVMRGPQLLERDFGGRL